MTQKKSQISLDEQLIDAKAYAKEQKQLRKIEKIKKRYEKKSPMGFDKKMFIFEMVDFIVVELFAMWAIVQDPSQLSSLLGLIAPVVGSVVAYKSYTDKATAQNTKGGITYDMAMKSMELNNATNINFDNGNVADDNAESVDSNAVG